MKVSGEIQAPATLPQSALLKQAQGAVGVAVVTGVHKTYRTEPTQTLTKHFVTCVRQTSELKCPMPIDPVEAARSNSGQMLSDFIWE